MQVVILKQPLYGTIEWNGVDFVYNSYTVENYNDYFIYSITENNKTTVYNKFVNADNVPPVANTVTLTAEAYGVNVINISSIAYDSTIPFGDLKIESVSGAIYGTAFTDGNNIYYTSNLYNNVENLTYIISDKQYRSTGTLSLSVVNGIVLDTSPKGLGLLYISKNKFEEIKPLSANWNYLFDILYTYGPIWDTVDYIRYIGISDIVENNSPSWIDFYNYRPELINYITTLSSNSAAWNLNVIDGVSIYNIINPKYKEWNDGYSLLSSINAVSNSFDLLSTELNDSKIIFNNLSQIVNDNKDILWDKTELYNISANYFNFWNQTISALNVGLWHYGYDHLNALSANLNQYTQIFEDLYNIISSNSAINWDNTSLNTISSIYFGLWDNVVSILSTNINTWNSINENLPSLSADIYDKTIYFDSLYNTITANAGNVWYSLTQDYLNKYDSSYSITNSSSASWITNDILSNKLDNYNSYNKTVTQNISSKWVPDTLNKILTSDSVSWDNTFNTLTSLSSNFNFDDTRNSLDFYNNLSSNSANWNNSYNLINLSSNNWNISNEISSVSSKYLSGDFSTPLTVNNLIVNNVLSTGGSFFITGELKKYDTVIVTTDSFIVYNESTNDALTVDKIGAHGLIATFKDPLSSNVMFVDSNHCVGINIPYEITENLTVSGNISASGYIYPYLLDTINTYKSVSAKYNNIYNSLTSSSATTISNLTSEKTKYDSLVEYENLSANEINGLLSTNYINYNNLYNTVCAQSAKNNIVKQYLDLSAFNVGVDTEFQNQKFKYDGLYNFYLNSQ